MAIRESRLFTERPGLSIADKITSPANWTTALPSGVRLIRPSYGKGTPHPDEPLLEPFRQLIESVNGTVETSRTRKSMADAPSKRSESVPPRDSLPLTIDLWHNRPQDNRSPDPRPTTTSDRVDNSCSSQRDNPRSNWRDIEIPSQHGQSLLVT
jgi:hypothetical protein